jgi:hypothetical protein
MPTQYICVFRVVPTVNMYSSAMERRMREGTSHLEAETSRVSSSDYRSKLHDVNTKFCFNADYLFSK